MRTKVVLYKSSTRKFKYCQEPEVPFKMPASGVSISKIAIRNGCYNATRKQSLSVFPQRVIKLQKDKINGLPQQKFKNQRVQSRSLPIVALALNSFDINISSPSPSKALTLFYDSINEKNFKQLDNLLWDDCFFEDYSFPKPFQGKQEFMKFLKQLITSMGPNMEFNIEHICEGDDLTAAVKWHLEWKKKQVPFTRGCSYCELSRDGERLLIKKIQVIIESPVKPGALSLALLKMITSVFDAFPEPAERFLTSPHVIFKLLLKVYNTVLKTIMNPIFLWYIKLWSFTVRIISFAVKLLNYIAKFFNM